MHCKHVGIALPSTTVETVSSSRDIVRVFVGLSAMLCIKRGKPRGVPVAVASVAAVCFKNKGITRLLLLVYAVHVLMFHVIVLICHAQHKAGKTQGRPVAVASVVAVRFKQIRA